VISIQNNLLWIRGLKLGTFDKYEMLTLTNSPIVSKIGENKKLSFHNTELFKQRQFTIKAWETIVDKNWICDNLELEVVDTNHIWRRSSALYSLFMQLDQNQFIEPITIFHRQGKYYVETGLQRYALNKILGFIELKAYVIDVDGVYTTTEYINKQFNDAKILNNLEIKLEPSNDWQNGEPCYQYVATPKFATDELANEHSTYRLEFASLVNNYKNSLTFWHKDSIVGTMDNNNPMLNVELYNIEGLAQFVLEHFCDHHEFRIEKQYRIME